MTLTGNRAVNRMKGYEILEEAIPRGEVEAIANLLGYSEDTVRRWRREPESTDDMSTGRRSPLDLILLLINAVYTRYPEGADLIVDRIVEERANLRRIHGQPNALPAEEIEGVLRGVMRSISTVADQFAGVNGNAGVQSHSSARPEREAETLDDQSQGRGGRKSSR